MPFETTLGSKSLPSCEKLSAYGANSLAVSSTIVLYAKGIEPSINVMTCFISATPFWNEKSAGGFGDVVGATKVVIVTVYV